MAGVFENFDRKVIRQVLKEFPTMDDAFIHLQEFMDLDYESDGNEEEQKGAAAMGQISASAAAEFDA